jgi:hypothetical protein
MDLFIAVGVLFALGYAAGFGIRTSVSYMRRMQRREREPVGDYLVEGPAWMR